MTNKDLQLYERIHEYLDGTLQGSELADFENQLKSDKDLAAEVTLHKNLSTMFEPEDQQVSQLRNTLQKVRQKTLIQKEEKPTAKIISFRRTLMAIAAVLLLGVVTYFTFLNIPSNEQLFAQNFETEQISFTSKSVNSEQKLADLQQAFNAKKYEESITISTQILTNNSSNYNAQLAKGLSQLNLNQYQAAIQTFQALDTFDRRETTDKAKWYLAMTYLKTNELDKCKSTLQAIIDEGAYFPKERDISKLINQLSR